MHINIRAFVRISILIITIFTSLSCHRLNEDEVFTQASQLEDTAERIAALENYVTSFPNGKNIDKAYKTLYRDCLQAGESDKAIEYTAKYLALFPEESRMNDYNSIAWNLAENKVGLDSAEVYAIRAVNQARANNNSRIKMILDTYAYVLFQNGKFTDAEIIQTEAIQGNESDPEYIYHLALYQNANGKTELALTNAAKTVLLGGESQALDDFNSWLIKAATSEQDQQNIARKIISTTVQEFLSDNDTKENRSKAALLMAKADVEMLKAINWAEDAVFNPTTGTDADAEISNRINLAAIYNQNKSIDKMLAVLTPSEEFASPYYEEFWLLLGQAFQQKGETDKAMDALLNGLIWRKNENVLAVARSIQPDEKEIDKLIGQRRNELINFNPGRYTDQAKTTGKVVLTELFTGAECNPCQAADYALDLLAEYYPRDMVAILEYHLHIPGPDPLTNTSSLDRYSYYGGDFGTPTVWFDGAGRLVGGGAKMVKKNNFIRYKYLIEKNLPDEPGVNISIQPSRQSDDVTISVEIAPLGIKSGDFNLLIALAERHVNYIGSNGVSRHTFVVRDLLDGAEGTEFSLKNESIRFNKNINLAKVEQSLAAYLDEFAKNPGDRFRNFSGWRARPDMVNRENLSLVVWVQERNSHKVVQAGYSDI